MIKTFFLALSCLLWGIVKTDPVPATLDVFCFRITDIWKANSNFPDDTFHVEFEILNWSDADAGGMQIHLAQGSKAVGTSGHIEFISGGFNGIDADGRPLVNLDVNGDGTVDAFDNEDADVDGLLDAGEDANGSGRLDNDPMPGNVDRTNGWTLDSESTTSMVWSTGEPLSHINLVEAGSAGLTCIAGGSTTPDEVIDDMENVQDGFVMTIANFKEGSVVNLNWFLTGAGGATGATQEPGLATECYETIDVDVGSCISNGYGSGLVSLARKDAAGGLPSPKFSGQTGFTQSARDFFGSVYNVPDPDNIAVKCAEFAVEFSPTITAPFCNTANGNTVFSLPGCPNQPNAVPISSGCSCCDPHFRTWAEEKYDFHGECDLVLLTHPRFRSGLGLDVHARTTMQGFFSFINYVGVRLGNETIEIDNLGHYKVNGSTSQKLLTEFAGIRVEHVTKGDRVKFKFHLNDETNTQIVVQAFHFMLNVDIHRGSDMLHGSLGMHGHPLTGEMVGRDGVEVFNDPVEFASQWQVGFSAADPVIFSERRSPQCPQTCKLPSSNTRKLRQSQSKTEEANKICAHWGDRVDECVFDVLATGNPELAKLL